MRRISTLENLISFVEIAMYKPEYGVAMTHLDVALSVSSAQRDTLQRYLPACLALTPNLAILELTITPPFTSFSFARIPLPYLEVVKSNLTHRSLAPFVSVRPRLQALDIAACGRTRKCPLSTVYVQQVTDIRCPLACVAGVVHDGVERLQLDHSRFATLPSTFLSKLPVVLGTVYVLTVDFTPDDDSILRAIAAHMPHIRDLKLIEYASSLVSQSHRSAHCYTADCSIGPQTCSTTMA